MASQQATQPSTLAIDEFDEVQDESNEEEAEKPKPWGRLFPISPDFETLELINDVYSIGRNPTCEFHFDDPVISNKHCIISREKAPDAQTENDLTFFIEDKSSNGTFVNDQRLGKNNKVVLKHGDRIALTQKKGGKTPSFVFHNCMKEESVSNQNPLTEKYHIMDSLGSGACGEVKLCVDKKTGYKFAVKILNKKRYNSVGPSTQSLIQEFDILKKLDHPNIVCCQEMFDTPDKLYIVLELAQGGDLFDRIVAKERFSEPEAKFFFLQLLEAVQYLHKNGVAHRDLKPENVLLSSKDMNALLKVTDFGLAKLVGPTSFMKTMCGTPSYQAPEVLLAGKSGTTAEDGYSSSVDMWSLGVILYIILCGFPPFADDITWHNYSLNEQILGGHYRFPDNPWKKISPDAIDLVKKLLTVPVKERYTVDECLNHPWMKDQGIIDLVRQQQDSWRVHRDKRTSSMEQPFGKRALDEEGASNPSKKTKNDE